MTITKCVLFVSEAATMLGCSSQTIYHLIHTNQLEAYKDEGHNTWRIPEAAIHNYITTRLRKRREGK